MRDGKSKFFGDETPEFKVSQKYFMVHTIDFLFDSETFEDYKDSKDLELNDEEIGSKMTKNIVLFEFRAAFFLRVVNLSCPDFCDCFA